MNELSPIVFPARKRFLNPMNPIPSLAESPVLPDTGRNPRRMHDRLT